MKFDLRWLPVIGVMIVLGVLFFITIPSQEKSIEEQEIVCSSVSGDLISRSVPEASRCLIDGEEIKFVETVNGWKLLIKDAYVATVEGDKNG